MSIRNKIWSKILFFISIIIILFLKEVNKKTSHLEKIIILKMNESSSIEVTNTYSRFNAIPLSDQTKLKVNEIKKIKGYFNAEIQERKIMSK